MKVIVIGGSGHVGTYLVPRLVRQGAEVVSVSRGQREPYTPDRAWGEVSSVDGPDGRGKKRGVRQENRCHETRCRHRHD
jgi:nucleoside-diphosphate-sugar epimerase